MERGFFLDNMRNVEERYVTRTRMDTYPRTSPIEIRLRQSRMTPIPTGVFSLPPPPAGRLPPSEVNAPLPPSMPVEPIKSTKAAPNDARFFVNSSCCFCTKMIHGTNHPNPTTENTPMATTPNRRHFKSPMRFTIQGYPHNVNPSLRIPRRVRIWPRVFAENSSPPRKVGDWV